MSQEAAPDAGDEAIQHLLRSYKDEPATQVATDLKTSGYSKIEMFLEQHVRFFEEGAQEQAMRVLSLARDAAQRFAQTGDITEADKVKRAIIREIVPAVSRALQSEIRARRATSAGADEPSRYTDYEVADLRRKTEDQIDAAINREASR